MRLVVADDEPLARDLLRTLLEELPGLAVAALAEDGEEAIAAARAHRPDLVFLDIDMPNGNGVHAALEIARLGAEVIFVTAHEEHAVDAFEVGAVDYLLKPVRRPRLARAIERARLRYEARRPAQSTEPTLPAPAQSAEDAVAAPEPAAAPDDAFWVPVLRGTVRVAVDDVERVEAAGDHVYLHAAGRAYLYRSTMAEMEQRLQGSGLLRVHRSAFIRPERVVATHRRGKVLALELSDGTQIPVGPRFRAAALALLGKTA
ncbi:LytR/AlgR family response regulator transcription factor [Sphingomonas parva]|nr:LytTR family DNA-binding domain-containing protein [Sphingomonas parva]